jgi:putative CocE/NonD family hydrolase
MQDVRGRSESEGEFIACTGQDREDGFDTVEWLSHQPWCSGRIGTIGASYTGETSAKTAAMRHPAHRCAVIMFDGSYAGGSARNGAFLQGGVSLLRMLFQWFRDWVPKVSYGPPPHIDREAWFSAPWADAYSTQPVKQPSVDLDAHLRTLPVFDLLDRSGAAPSEFADMMRRAADPCDPYWTAQRFLTDDDRFDIPALYVTGHLERGGSSFDNFRIMRRNCAPDVGRHQHLLVTPAPHSAYHLCSAETRHGARDLGDTRFPYYRLLVDWFGRWLRDDDVEASAWPPVRYFVINGSSWCDAEDWPPPDTSTLSLHLRSVGRANTSGGDGSLTPDDPGAAEPADRFTYDPDNPVPSEPRGADLDTLGGGYADRSDIERRDDVLVYTSAPLDSPLHIAGPVAASLYVSSNAPDTDFSAVLTEVDRVGRSINSTHGIARVRYRDGLARARLLERGRVY